MTEATDIDNEGLDELFEKYRKSPDSYVFVLVADACRKIERIDEALEICRKGIDRHPRYASGYVVKGKCHYDLGEQAAARDTFEQVLSLDENNLVALKFLGMIDAEQGDYESARAHFQHILQLDPDNKMIKETLHALAEQEQMGKSEVTNSSPAEAAPAGEDSARDPASATFGVAEGLETSDELASLTLADIFASQGYRDKAIKICEEVLKKNPRNRVVQDKLKSLGGEVSVSDEVPSGVQDRDTAESLNNAGRDTDDPNAIELGGGEGDPGTIELDGAGAPANVIELGGNPAGGDALETDDEADGRDTVDLTGPVDERGAIQLPHTPTGASGEARAETDPVAPDPESVTAGRAVSESPETVSGKESEAETENPVGFTEIRSEVKDATKREGAGRTAKEPAPPKRKSSPGPPPQETRRSIDDSESRNHFKRWLGHLND